MALRSTTIAIALRSAGSSKGLRAVLNHRPWMPRPEGNQSWWFSGSLSMNSCLWFGMKTKDHSTLPVASAVVAALLSLYAV